MIRVLVCAACPESEAALASIVHSDQDIEVVGETSRPDAVHAASLLARPDVVVLEVGDMQAQTLERRGDLPWSFVLVVDSLTGIGFDLLTAGAFSAVTAADGGQALLECIHVAAAGHVMLGARVWAAFSAQVKALRPARHADLAARLSPREREVLERLAHGWSDAEIAQALFIAEATVRSHVHHLIGKFQLRNRRQLLAFAHRNGLVTASGPAPPDQSGPQEPAGAPPAPSRHPRADRPGSALGGR